MSLIMSEIKQFVTPSSLDTPLTESGIPTVTFSPLPGDIHLTAGNFEIEGRGTVGLWPNVPFSPAFTMYKINVNATAIKQRECFNLFSSVPNEHYYL